MDLPSVVSRRPRTGVKRDRDFSALKCPVCLELKLPTVVCGGGHTACGPCAAGLARNKGCPLCREPLLPTFAPVRSLVDALDARMCVFATTGCDSVFLSREELEAHQELCDFESMACTNVGCGRPILLSQWSRHVHDECPLRLVCCTHPSCEERMPQRDLVGHLLRCGHRLRVCPLCVSRVPQGQLLAHLDEKHGVTHEAGEICEAALASYADGRVSMLNVLPDNYLLVRSSATDSTSTKIQFLWLGIGAADGAAPPASLGRISVRIYADLDLTVKNYLQFHTDYNTTHALYSAVLSAVFPPPVPGMFGSRPLTLSVFLLQ